MAPNLPSLRCNSFCRKYLAPESIVLSAAISSVRRTKVTRMAAARSTRGAAMSAVSSVTGGAAAGRGAGHLAGAGHHRATMEEITPASDSCSTARENSAVRREPVDYSSLNHVSVVHIDTGITIVGYVHLF